MSDEPLYDKLTREEVLEVLEEHEAMTADGFDEALVGYAERFGMGPIALYDRQKYIEILMRRDGMTEEGAEEFFEVNVIGAWVGEGTPAFATFIEGSGTTSKA